MTQQTAMQALVEQMKINDIYKPCMPYLLEIIDEVYLPMEKKQIMDAVMFGLDEDGHTGDWKLSVTENYYNKTYKNENN